MTDALIMQYLPIIIFLGIMIVLATVMMVIPYLVARIRPDHDKLSPYECGFEAFNDSRMQFDVRFYLISILFIIFDLEIAFLFPWSITLGALSALGFWSMMSFLLVLTIGFIYEWRRGALEWK